MSVYFVQSGPYIKIGYSADPLGRSTTVTTSGKRPRDLPRGSDASLIGWVPGDRMTEIRWHAKFADDHVCGEWFYIDPEVIHPLIWNDPCGVDLQRMSALAVLTADRHPDISRNQIVAAGVPLEAAPMDQVVAHLWSGGAA